MECSISYRSFCNSYYRLTETILRLLEKERHNGILALEDDLDSFDDRFFLTGMKLVIDGTDSEYIRRILQTRLEREHDFYRKKLMEVAMEGILCIQDRKSKFYTAFLLDSLVNIKNKPLEDACAKYIIGDIDAFSDLDFNIDFKTAIKSEEEREEIRFIKRAVSLNKISHEKSILALEEYLDHDAIAARDVFECGLLFVIMGWNWEYIEKVLSNLIGHETDPVKKNIAQAKKAAVLSIYGLDSPGMLITILCAFFDENISRDLEKYFEDL